MAKISAFEGIRYNAKIASDLKAVTAPPYDVLSKDQVAHLHAQNQFNITHLTRPQSYQEAGKIWEKWRADGTLVQDEPSLYLYSQTFSDPETGRQMPPRLGLICALELEDYSSGTVVPHENTIAAHRADRLELMRTTHANLESIYGLYSDQSGIAMRILHAAASEAPLVGMISDQAGSDHKLQQITDPGIIDSLIDALESTTLLIADGHHRYETALAYCKEHAGEAGASRILITLTAFEDKGLLVLPTHRLVRGLSTEIVQNLSAKLKESGFDISKISLDTPALAPGSLGFDVFTQNGVVRALLPNGVKADSVIHENYSVAWKSLDVSLLSILVLDKIFGIPLDALSSTDQVRYTRDRAEAIEKVEAGEFDAAFLLTRPTMENIQAVGAAGEKMPQKSTFFYPKLLSGLVTRSLI